MKNRDCEKYGCQVYIAHQVSHYELTVCITCGTWFVKKSLGTYVGHGEYENALAEYKYFLALGRTTFV